MEERGNLPMIGEPLRRENTSRASPEKAAQMAVELERLAIHCHRPDMDRTKLQEWFRTFVEDLARFTIQEIREGCTRWRQSGERFFPTPGQLMAAIRECIGSAKISDQGRPGLDGKLHPWGGECDCEKCRNKTPHDGFYHASKAEHDQADRLRQDVDYRTEMVVPPSKLDEDEMRLRNQMINRLVMGEGMDREAARRKVMTDRTRALYPENKWTRMLSP